MQYFWIISFVLTIVLGFSLRIFHYSIGRCLWLDEALLANNIIMPNLEEVKQDLERMVNAADGAIVHPEQEQLVKECIIEIMKIALTKTVHKEDLLAALTETEKSAFKVILAKLIDGEGAVSISQLTTESGISRPVFKSVLQKLKDMEIAEINNMGVKGTYINIIDGAFLDIDSFID